MKFTVRSTLAELQTELRSRGLPTDGAKVDLLARVHAAAAASALACGNPRGEPAQGRPAERQAPPAPGSSGPLAFLPAERWRRALGLHCAEASSAAARAPDVAPPEPPAAGAAELAESAGGLAAFLASGDEAEEQPPPVRKRLRRLESAEAAPPEPERPDRVAEVIARLADPQRDEVVIRQLKRLEPGTYARLLREGAAHLDREDVRAQQGAADVYVPWAAGRRRQSWVWQHAYLLHSRPGESFCRRCCPLAVDGSPTDRSTWAVGGVIGYPKSRITTNLANHLKTHGRPLSGTERALALEGPTGPLPASPRASTESSPLSRGFSALGTFFENHPHSGMDADLRK